MFYEKKQQSTKPLRILRKTSMRIKQKTMIILCKHSVCCAISCEKEKYVFQSHLFPLIFFSSIFHLHFVCSILVHPNFQVNLFSVNVFDLTVAKSIWTPLKFNDQHSMTLLMMNYPPRKERMKISNNVKPIRLYWVERENILKSMIY